MRVERLALHLTRNVALRVPAGPPDPSQDHQVHRDLVDQRERRPPTSPGAQLPHLMKPKLLTRDRPIPPV